jgi:MFS family permease
MELRIEASHRPAADDYLVSRPYAWFVFALTILLMLFDFIDRQIIVSMFPFIKAQWSLSDTQLGALLSVVSMTVGLCALPVALIADRWSRVKSVFLMAAGWSLGTIACAFTANYSQLFAARAVVGVGEAGYLPVGGALLSSLFPARMRALILAAFTSAAAIGAVLGVLLGGFLAVRYGWQAAFGIVGVPGLVVAVLYLVFVRDYQTVPLYARSDASGRSRPGIGGMAAELFRARSMVATYVGQALQLFFVSTLFAWLPSFFNRALGLPPDQAGVRAAVILIVGSLAGIAWGHFADRLGARSQRNKLRVMAFVSFASCAVLAPTFGLMEPGLAQFVMIAVGTIFITGTTGTASAVLIDVVHPGLRATAVGMLAFVQNIFGMAAGPVVSGALSDAFGLTVALAVVPVFGLLAAIAFMVGSRSFEHDLAAARESRPNMPAAPDDFAMKPQGQHR